VRLGPLVENIWERMTPAKESVLEGLMQAEFADSVQSVVAKLPTDQRMVVVLRYTERVGVRRYCGGIGLVRRGPWHHGSTGPIKHWNDGYHI